MSMPANRLSMIANRLDALNATRKAVILEGLQHLESLHPALAEMLLARFATPDRAAAWMSVRHRALDGQTGWEMVADGGLQEVWELLEGTAPA